MEIFTYKEVIVELIDDIRKKKPIIWIKVNGHYLTCVSKRDTAKRLACNFIDTVFDKYYQGSRQQLYKKARIEGQKC